MAEKIHMVPVPESALPAVYGLLARLTSDASGVQEGSAPWVAADMGKLAAMVKNPAGRAIITAIARRSTKGESTTYAQLRAAAADAVGEFTFSRVQAQLSWVAKYCKKIKGENVWPLTVSTQADMPRGERYTYTMTKPLATAWLDTVKAQEK